jgi:surfeit locus 1 family protein
VIGVLQTDGRRVMADLGFVGLDAKDTPRIAGTITLRGHLHWPDEVDSWTPAPEADLWFGRDVPAMAAALGTEPVLIVVARMSPPVPGVTPLPIDTSDIPNDHLGYAITWFSLAFVWAIMSGFFIIRMGRRPAKD